MRLSRKLSWAAALIVALILGSGCAVALLAVRQATGESRAREVATEALVLSTAETQAASLAASHAEILAQDADIIRLMAAGDRPGLLAATADRFRRLKAEAGVNVMQFHTPDLKSFLRVWDPDNFGQDLSKVRPMLLAVNHDRRPQKGLEIGLSGLSLRAAAPILDGDRLVGTVEVGVDLKSLLDLAKASTGADFGLFLDATLLKDGGAAPLKRDVSTNGDLFDRIAAEGRVQMSRDSTFGRVETGDAVSDLYGMPLVDYSGRMIGTIVVLADATLAARAEARLAVVFVTIALVGGLAVHGFLLIALRAMLVRPLADLTTRVAGLGSAGDLGAPVTSDRDFLALHAAVEAAVTARKDAGEASP